MALHVYINESSKQIDRASFSILRIVESDDHKIMVYPVSELPQEFVSDKTRGEITQIYNRITGKSVDMVEILAEYEVMGLEK